VDQQLTDAKLKWRRYVTIRADYGLASRGYRALAILAHALADYGLTLNRTKTTLLTSKHFVDYVRANWGMGWRRAETS